MKTNTQVKRNTVLSMALVAVLLAVPTAKASTFTNVFAVNLSPSQLTEMPLGSGRINWTSPVISLASPVTVVDGDILDWTFNFASGGELTMIEDGDRSGLQNFGIRLTGTSPGALFFNNSTSKTTVSVTGGSIVSLNPFLAQFSGGTGITYMLGGDNIDLTDTSVSYDGLSYFTPMLDSGIGSSFTINSVEIMANAGEITMVIPEPATMSLLAVGGLALIRRRRK